MTRFIDLKHMVHHHVHRTAFRLEKGNSSLKRVPGSLAIDRRKNDQTGMEVGGTHQSAEVPRIARDHDAILGKAPGQHPVIRLATTPDMQRVHCIVPAGGIQAKGDLRRQALVNEQLHAASAQGRPPGRPTSG